jgi:NTP pyrophosphatase (non-canonical NTP hydrolase)
MTLNDQQVCIAELKQVVNDFVVARQWTGNHTPKNLAVSIAIESAELMEIFQWSNSENTSISYTDIRQYIEEELADVLIYCISFSNQMGIDITSSVLAKIKRNEKKYPVGHDLLKNVKE